MTISVKYQYVGSSSPSKLLAETLGLTQANISTILSQLNTIGSGGVQLDSGAYLRVIGSTVSYTNAYVQSGVYQVDILGFPREKLADLFNAGTKVSDMVNYANNFAKYADDDNIVGTAYSDYLEGGVGNDTINGMEGTDTATYYSAKSAVNVNLMTGKASGGDGNDILISIEDVDGSIYNDTIMGNSGDNYLYGLDGNDTLNGGAGNDYLYGDDGDDKMAGGAGDDTFTVNQKGDVVTEKAGEGNDYIYLSKDYITPNAKFISYTMPVNVEMLGLSNLAIISTLIGNKSDNTISGNSSANTLNGKEGNDSLSGGTGNDTFTFDTKLTSTKSADGVITFTNVDSIADFKNGGDLDVINLSKRIFAKAVKDVTDTDAANGTNLAATDLVSGASLDLAMTARTGDTANAHLLFDSVSGALYYDADGSGKGTAVQFATLTGITTLAASDLHIV